MSRRSGLTMNIDQTNLPAVPCFVAQPPASGSSVCSFVGQESKEPICGSDTLLKDFPLVTTSSAPSGRRARYILPPSQMTSNEQTPCSLPSMPTTERPSMPPIPPDVSPANKPVDCRPSESVLSNPPTSLIATPYEPVGAVWFYATQVNMSKVWWPFSCHDSYRIESEYLKFAQTDFTKLADSVEPTRRASSDSATIQVEGGRYDVSVNLRERYAVYWDEPVTEIRRATWFYRSPDENRVLPFSERMCESLEAQYKLTVEQNRWGQRFELPSEDMRGGIDYFIFHNPQSMIQYLAWPYSAHTPHGIIPGHSVPESHSATDENRICYIRRGLDDQLLGQLDDGEFRPIDHVFFVVHGIGSVYNLRGEGLVECVNDLRRTAREMARAHFPIHANRAEFLPILWHNELHSDATGIDEQLNQLTLRSIPKLRQFTNSTLTDILFYTSNKYCQLIVDTVAKSLVRLRDLFLSRNPNYSGGFSIIGHSLGAVIVFDLLAHQPPQPTPECGKEECGADENEQANQSEDSAGTGVESEKWSLVDQDEGAMQRNTTLKASNAHIQSEDMKLKQCLIKSGISEETIKQILQSWSRKDGTIIIESVSSASSVSEHSHSFWSASRGQTSAGFGMPVIVYPQLGFPVKAFFMFGSPLPLFLTARGIQSLPTDYGLPTCSVLFNIFHPFDPVAYRMEMLVHPMYQPRAVLIPHHKGRKRFHLQLRDELVRVGSDLKTKIYNSFQSTWRSLQEFAMSHRPTGGDAGDASAQGQESTDESENPYARILSRLDDTMFATRDQDEDDAACRDPETETIFNSQLNQGRRIDYVLQEAPLESFSDYLFALSSHAAYWESEDTALFLLNEIYSIPTASVDQPSHQSQSKLLDRPALSATVSAPFPNIPSQPYTAPLSYEATSPPSTAKPGLPTTSQTRKDVVPGNVALGASPHPATLPDVIDSPHGSPRLPPDMRAPTPINQPGARTTEFTPFRHHKAPTVRRDSPQPMEQLFNPPMLPVSSDPQGTRSFLPLQPPAPLPSFPSLVDTKNPLGSDSSFNPLPSSQPY